MNQRVLGTIYHTYEGARLEMLLVVSLAGMTHDSRYDTLLILLRTGFVVYRWLSTILG